MNERRSFPWAWVLLAILLVVIVGGIAYFAGAHMANPAVTGYMRPFRGFAFHTGGFGLGIGFWAIVLLVAILVGLLVAAIAGPSRAETFEEWHRRVHEQGSGDHGPDQPPPAPPGSSPGSTGSTPGSTSG